MGLAVVILNKRDKAKWEYVCRTSYGAYHHFRLNLIEVILGSALYIQYERHHHEEQFKGRVEFVPKDRGIRRHMDATQADEDLLRSWVAKGDLKVKLLRGECKRLYRLFKKFEGAYKHIGRDPELFQAWLDGLNKVATTVGDYIVYC